MKNKHKIALFVSDTNPAGLLLVGRLLAEYIDRSKYHVIVVSCGPGPYGQIIGDYADEYHNLKTGSFPPLHKFKKGKHVIDIFAGMKLFLWFIRSSWKLAFWLRANKIDLIHSHGDHFNLIAGISAKIVGTTSLWHIHNPQVFPWSKGGTLLAQGYLGSFLATHIVTVSAFEAGRYHHSWKNKVTVVPNGVDVQAISSGQHSGELRKLIQAREGERIVGIIAILCARKGLPRFVEMAAKVLESRSDVKFVIMGRILDELSEKIVSDLSLQAEALGIADKFCLVRDIDNASNFISDMDVFFMCSVPYTETFGLVVLEAMAAGVAVVSFANDAIPEIIEDNKNGFLVPDGDIANASARILELLEDDGLAERIEKQAYKDVGEKFDISVFIDNIQKVYSKLLNE
ncbi:MAG: glycosyltransferase family 4 protein [Planctomycetes bacterium]|nr:glycosyltransferase family 4 protein [Planctomycetota bacterium]